MASRGEPLAWDSADQGQGGEGSQETSVGPGWGPSRRGAMWRWGGGPRSLCLQTRSQSPHSPTPGFTRRPFLPRPIHALEDAPSPTLAEAPSPVGVMVRVSSLLEPPCCVPGKRAPPPWGQRSLLGRGLGAPSKLSFCPPLLPPNPPRGSHACEGESSVSTRLAPGGPRYSVKRVSGRLFLDELLFGCRVVIDSEPVVCSTPGSSVHCLHG